MVSTLTVVVLLLTGVYSMRSVLHFNFRKFVVENVTVAIAPKVEKPIYNSNLKDRRDPYRNYPQIFNVDSS